jgi:hypothetical protein
MCTNEGGSLKATAAIAADPNPNWYRIGEAIGISDGIRINYPEAASKEPKVRGIRATEAFDEFLVLHLDDGNTIVLAQWFRGEERGFGWSFSDRKAVLIELVG